MADNITLDSGSGGATVKTDDDGTAHWPYTKLAFGADNTQTIVASISSNPLPVALSSTDNAVLDTINTAVELIDDTVYIDDADWTDSTSKHLLVGGVYQSSPQTITDGDVGPLEVTTNGYLIVSVNGTVTVASHAVTNAGTFAVQEDGASLTALQLIDDIVYIDDTSTHATGTTKGAGIMAAATPTDGSVGANDIGMLAMSTDRRLHTDAQLVGQDADITIADGGNAITVDWSGTTPPIGAGTEAAALRVTLATDSTGLVSIDDNGGSITVDNGGTFATQATLQANSGVDVGDVDVTSIVPGTAATNLGKAVGSAEGATDTGIAMLALRDDEGSAQEADADYVVPRCDKFGALRTTELPDATSEIKYAIIDAASSGDNTIQAAAGSGIKIRVLSAFMVSAGTVNVRFESAAGGTAKTGQMNLVKNSGFTLGFNPGGWFETADNALLNLELSASVSVDGCLSYVEV